MELGAFSISLAVKDIEASRRFYGKFGLRVFAGDAAQNWLIPKNEEDCSRACLTRPPFLSSELCKVA
jgi:hypothetical protein